MTDTNSPKNNSVVSKLIATLKEYDLRLLVFGACFAIIISYVIYTIIYGDVQVTDNAVVRCDKIDVISEVSGILSDIYVSDDTYYEKGVLLAKINDDVLSSQQKQAQSELALAEAMLQFAKSNERLVKVTQQSDSVISMANLDASRYQKESVAKQILELKSKLLGAQGSLEQAKRNLDRQEKLVKDNLISKNQLENTRLKHRLAWADKAGVESQLESMLAIKKVRQAEVTQSNESYRTNEEVNNLKLEQARTRTLNALAKANLAREGLQHASIMLDKTNVLAKRSGYVTNTRIFKGDFVEVGQPIASIISCGESAWVEANFKETQITEMTKGQKSEFRLDAYPDTVITGTVEGLSYGSGATFSVLPPENAVGNYTKVVQRFPVKIRVDPSENVKLRAGMSAVVKVYTKPSVEEYTVKK